MTQRQQVITRFLSQTDWANASVSPLAGDASLRKYLRVAATDALPPAVLMDADPALGNDVRPFVAITDYLRAQSLSAPQIYAQDVDQGLLLIEDLGDDLFARVLAQTPVLETPLYDAATDVLLDLHNRTPPKLAAYDAGMMTQMACLSYTWYRSGVLSGTHPSDQDAFAEAFHSALSTQIDPPSVLIQRDYHAENLLWLPARVGSARVGLLDYQDALLGHRAYDLVSLLKDARRDVSPAVEEAMITRYIDRSNEQDTAFRRAYHLLGLQRNLRILGVFARLSLHYAKPGYIDLIPRVWRFIERDLDTEACAPFANQVRADLPTPTPDLLQTLKDKCGTIPTLS